MPAVIEICYNRKRDDDQAFDHYKLYYGMGFVKGERNFRIQNCSGVDVYSIDCIVWIKVNGRTWLKRRESKKYG